MWLKCHFYINISHRPRQQLSMSSKLLTRKNLWLEKLSLIKLSNCKENVLFLLLHIHLFHIFWQHISLKKQIDMDMETPKDCGLKNSFLFGDDKKRKMFKRKGRKHNAWKINLFDRYNKGTMRIYVRTQPGNWSFQQKKIVRHKKV